MTDDIMPKNKMTTLLLWLQAAALLAGNYVGWTTIFKEARAYCDQFDGSLWRLTDFSGTVTGNPLLTPCFWGSIVFVISLVWTLWILFAKSSEAVRTGVSRLWWLLLVGVIFAAANNVPIFYNFYTRPRGSFVSCSADLVTNPYLTSCFLGFSAFLAAFVFATMTRHYLSRQTTPQ